MRQLALPFPHDPPYGAASFIAAPCNAAALAWLDRAPSSWPGLRLAVWGEPGCGKTHLLHRWAERHGALLLQGGLLRGLPPPPDVPLGIDDADATPEEATLLHLLNAAAEAGQPILLAGRTAPARWRVGLPDLASRLRAITAVPIGAPDDDLLRGLLARLLIERQLPVAEAVQDWMLRHLPRSPAALREAAALLDRGALAAGRHVTRRLAEELLAPLLAGSDVISASASPETAQTTPLL